MRETLEKISHFLLHSAHQGMQERCWVLNEMKEVDAFVVYTWGCNKNIKDFPHHSGHSSEISCPGFFAFTHEIFFGGEWILLKIQMPLPSRMKKWPLKIHLYQGQQKHDQNHQSISGFIDYPREHWIIFCPQTPAILFSPSILWKHAFFMSSHNFLLSGKTLCSQFFPSSEWDGFSQTIWGGSGHSSPFSWGEI